MLTNSCVKLQTVHTIPVTMNKEGKFQHVLYVLGFNICFNVATVICIMHNVNALLFTDDESSGLYGFLNVIVHSASGLKQSLSKWLILLFLTRKSSH